jgi:hypothetical protein
MDPSVVTGLAAVLGSLVGGFSTLATAWVTQRTQTRRQLLETEIRKREQLYAEFIAECSKLAVDALDHNLEGTQKVFQVYALQNRIRLVATDAVVASTDYALSRIFQQYFGPNLSKDELRQLALSRSDDPLKPFSEACRGELASLRASL